MLGNCVEVFFSQFHVGMCRPHVFAVIHHGSAERVSEKFPLFTPLARHVNVSEEVLDAVVCKHFLIKQIHGCIDGRASTDVIVKDSFSISVWVCVTQSDVNCSELTSLHLKLTAIYCKLSLKSLVTVRRQAVSNRSHPQNVPFKGGLLTRLEKGMSF